MLPILCLTLTATPAIQEIERVLPPQVSITLQVKSDQRQPVPGVVLRYRVQGDGRMHETEVDASGEARLSVPPGTFLVETLSVPEEFFPVRWAGKVTGDFDQGVFPIRLPRWREVPVLVKDFHGNPARDVALKVHRDAPSSKTSKGEWLPQMAAAPIFDAPVLTDEAGTAQLRIPHRVGMTVTAGHDDLVFRDRVMKRTADRLSFFGVPRDHLRVLVYGESLESLEGAPFWLLRERRDEKGELLDPAYPFDTIATGSSIEDGWIVLPPSTERKDLVLAVRKEGFDLSVTRFPQEGGHGVWLRPAKRYPAQVVDAEGEGIGGAVIRVKASEPLVNRVLDFHPDFSDLSRLHADGEGRFEVPRYFGPAVILTTEGQVPPSAWDGYLYRNESILLRPKPQD